MPVLELIQPGLHAEHLARPQLHHPPSLNRQLDAALEYIRKDIVRSSSAAAGQELALERAYGLYVLAAEYRNEEQLAQGFASALVLLLLTAGLLVGAHVLQRGMERRWKA